MKTRFNRREFSLGALAAGTALTSAGRPARAQAAPVKIRVGWVVVPASLAPLILEKKDILKHFGQSYVAEATRFEGTPPVITALASSELDIGPLAFSSFGLAIQNAHMDDLRVISDEIQDGIAGHGSNEFMVLKDGPVKTVADLKGKVLATNAMGSAVDIAMRAMLRKHGLEANRDYTIVEAPFPAMKGMLAEKKVDLITGVLLFKPVPELKKIATPLFDMRDAIGVSQFVMWSARKPFIDAHRAVLVDFLEDTLRIARWYLDPKNHDAAADIASQMTKQPADHFGWLFTKNDYFRDQNLLPNLDALQKNVDMTKDLGLVNTGFDVKTHSDLSLMQEAAKRLK